MEEGASPLAHLVGHYRRQRELECDRQQIVVILEYLVKGLDFTLEIMETYQSFKCGE